MRKYLGWLRLDADPAIADCLNAYYDTLDRYVNHFQTVRRTLTKEKINSRYRRTFERVAKTPYQRFMEHPAIPNTDKVRMQTLHESLNPLLLKEKLDTVRKQIFDWQKMKYAAKTSETGSVSKKRRI